VDKDKVLITGARGFVGWNLLKRLAGEYEIFCLDYQDDFPSKLPCNYIKQDLRQELDESIFPKNIDVIVHLAANTNLTDTRENLFQANVKGTFRLLEWARKKGAKSLIYASTGDIYGYCSKPSGEKTLPHPRNFYAFTKYLGELLVKEYNEFFPVIILRLFFPYGGAQRNRLIPRLVEKVIQKEPVIVYKGDFPHLNPIHIRDVTEVICRCMKIRRNLVMNVAGDEITTPRLIAQSIGRILHLTPLYKIVEKHTVGDMVGDNTIMKKTLGYELQVKLEEGIKDVVKGVASGIKDRSF